MYIVFHTGRVEPVHARALQHLLHEGYMAIQMMVSRDEYESASGTDREIAIVRDYPGHEDGRMQHEEGQGVYGTRADGTTGPMSNNEYDNLTKDEIISCADPSMGNPDRLSVDWEHGSWWLTNLNTGAQWSVHLCSGPEALVFEQVSSGDEE